jgi:hypothetical protein
MSGEQLWSKINQSIGNEQIDIKTVPSNNRSPLWFIAYIMGYISVYLVMMVE